MIQAAILGVLLMFAFQFFLSKHQQPRKVTKKVSVENTQDPMFTPSRRIGRTITVETPLYRAKVSNVNGKIVSFFIKKYKKELVPKDASKAGAFPLLTLTDNKTLNTMLSKVKLSSNINSISLKNGKKILVLVGKLKNGLPIQKSLTFHADSYRVNVRVRIGNQKVFELIPNVNSSKIHTSRMGHSGPIVYEDKKIKRFDPKKINALYLPSVSWAGQENKYFIMAAKDSSFPCRIEKFGSHTLVFVNLNNATFFFGPKELKRLQPLGMDKAIDLGFFGFLTKPFLWLFLFLHRFIPNYGIVIILLTLVIKVILHPLTHKGFKSMKNMQDLAPKLDEVKKRYAKDPQKLNEAVMKLYKEEGINPLSGCLPMLLQVPIFFALYEIFLNAVELKGVSFLWVKDLSLPDPTFLLPILMGISMIIQQKLTPTNNPQQEKIFLIMAIVFTFMFAKFPAGLVLYWFTNNVITAIQNLIINKTISRET